MTVQYLSLWKKCLDIGYHFIARGLKNGIGFGSSEYIVFRSNGEVISDYLYYFLSREQFRKEGKKLMTGTSGHSRVSKEFVENYKLPYPKSVSEQKRIVGILDEVFEGVAKAKENTEKNLENARELFESYLQNVFANPRKGWEEKNLESMTTKIGSGATPRGGKKVYKEIGISLVRSLNVFDDGFREKNLAFIDDEQALRLSNVVLASGDVLLNITGASITRCCVIPNDILPARVNQHVSIVRPITKLVGSRFLHYSLISRVNKLRLLDIARSGGSTREALTKANLNEFTVHVPKSVDEQKRIVKELDDLSEKAKKLEGIYEKKLADLEELKKSVLKKAFAGEL